MRTTKINLFFVNQHEKEEEWLNSMAANGKAMVCYKFPFFYEFEDCEPNQYTYRIELLDDQPNCSKSREYIEFLEDTGVEMMGSYMRWVYFRKKTKDGPFDLFSDLESKIKHYQRICKFLLPFLLLELSIGCLNMSHTVSSGYSFRYFPAGLILFLALVFGLFEISLLRRIYKLKKENLIRE